MKQWKADFFLGCAIGSGAGGGFAAAKTVNIGLNRSALVIITAGNIVFINKIMQNSIDSLGHILFRSEHRWEDPNITNPPTITNHPTKNSNAKVSLNGPVYTRGRFSVAVLPISAGSCNAAPPPPPKGALRTCVTRSSSLERAHTFASFAGTLSKLDKTSGLSSL